MRKIILILMCFLLGFSFVLSATDITENKVTSTEALFNYLNVTNDLTLSGFLKDATHSLTVTETYLMNNSNSSNSSNYWDDLDSPADILFSDLGCSSFDISGCSGDITIDDILASYTETDEINISYLFSRFTNGGMDLTGDPWYIGGTDFRVGENFSVDGETYLEHTNVSSLNVSGMTTTATLNITNNFIYGDLYLADYFSGACGVDEAINDIDEWGTFSCVDISGASYWTNVSRTITTYHDVNTTQNISTDANLSVGAGATITEKLLVGTVALGGQILWLNGRLAFDENNFDDIYITNLAERLIIFDRSEADTNKFSSLEFNPEEGIVMQFGIGSPPVLFSNTAPTIIGKSTAYIKSLYVGNITDVNNTFTPTEYKITNDSVTTVSTNVSNVYNIINRSIEDYTNDTTGGIWTNVSRTAIYYGDVNATENFTANTVMIYNNISFLTSPNKPVGSIIPYSGAGIYLNGTDVGTGHSSAISLEGYGILYHLQNSQGKFIAPDLDAQYNFGEDGFLWKTMFIKSISNGSSNFTFADFEAMNQSIGTGSSSGNGWDNSTGKVITEQPTLINGSGTNITYGLNVTYVGINATTNPIQGSMIRLKKGTSELNLLPFSGFAQTDFIFPSTKPTGVQALVGNATGNLISTSWKSFLAINENLDLNTTFATADMTIATGHYAIYCNATTGNVNITVPKAGAVGEGNIIIVKKIDDTANFCILDGSRYAESKMDNRGLINLTYSQEVITLGARTGAWGILSYYNQSMGVPL